MGCGEARDPLYKILRSHVSLDGTGKRFGLKQSSWPLRGHPLISAWNTKLYAFLYLRTLCLPKRQSSLAARTLLSYVENASSSPYFKSGPSEDLKLNSLGARCCSMQYTSLYAHWHLHTWFLGCGESYLQLEHTSSTAKIWGYVDTVETPPATLRIPFLELSVNTSLEWLMGSSLTTKQCQLTDGSLHAWWQDYRHLGVKRQPGSTNDSGVTWSYIEDLNLLDEFDLYLPRLWVQCFQDLIFWIV